MAKHKEKTDAELRQLEAQPPASSTQPTVLKVKRWVKQPNIELALHPSVVATLEGLKAENDALQKRVEQNSATYAKIVNGQLKYYNIAYNPNLGSIEWLENNSVISIPQPDKLKES